MIAPIRNPRTALDWLRHVRALIALEAVGDAMSKSAASSAMLRMRALLDGAEPFALEVLED